ncbi:MAG: AraC family transcriptional regulator [Hyphomicrobiaceae bacterium]|nr:AraC family transcriptional regulator [Hyphomicrobiaceae bacterium]
MGATLKYWREHVGRSLLNLDFRPIGDDPVAITMTPIVMNDGVRAVDMRHTPGMTFRDDELVKDQDASIAIVLAQNAAIDFRHCGREGRLKKGGTMLLVNAATGEIGAGQRLHFRSIVLSAANAGLSTAESSILAARAFRPTASLRLLRRYMALLCREPSPSPALADVSSRHLTELARLALREQLALGDLREAPAGHGIRDARTRVALDCIEQGFRDPDLSLDRVASQQGISTRYLHDLLERVGIRFTAHVLALRLAEVVRLFEATKQAPRPILDIAMAAGFADVSHFNRVFRQHYGMTPSAMRDLIGRRISA